MGDASYVACAKSSLAIIARFASRINAPPHCLNVPFTYTGKSHSRVQDDTLRAVDASVAFDVAPIAEMRIVGSRRSSRNSG